MQAAWLQQHGLLCQQRVASPCRGTASWREVLGLTHHPLLKHTVVAQRRCTRPRRLQQTKAHVCKLVQAHLAGLTAVALHSLAHFRRLSLRAGITWPGKGLLVETRAALGVLVAVVLQSKPRACRLS